MPWVAGSMLEEERRLRAPPKPARKGAGEDEDPSVRAMPQAAYGTAFNGNLVEKLFLLFVDMLATFTICISIIVSVAAAAIIRGHFTWAGAGGWQCRIPLALPRDALVSWAIVAWGGLFRRGRRFRGRAGRMVGWGLSLLHGDRAALSLHGAVVVGAGCRGRIGRHGSHWGRRAGGPALSPPTVQSDGCGGLRTLAAWMILLT